MSKKNVVEGCQDIVQGALCMRPLDYHAFCSALRTHDSAGEPYLNNKRIQVENSIFVSFSNPTDPSSALTYQPTIGGESVTITPSDVSSTPYKVSISARAIITSEVAGFNDTFQTTSFHDTPTKMEHTLRHPFTTMDSDCEEDEDMTMKYPDYQANNCNSPITTTAAENLHCIAFVGPKGQLVSELKASYPLQLSVRIDESRKCVIFDCFEFKPTCADIDDPDLTKYRPTGRGYERFSQAFQSHDISVDEDFYEDDDMDDEYYTNQMEMNYDGETLNRDTDRFLMFCGVAGNFAYSRCLRFRFPFNNIIGMSLQKSNPGIAKGSKNVGAVLILELSRPPPDDAFAVRKVESRWSRENEFRLIGDWTLQSAASKATRIYLYGSLSELKQTAALMAKKWPHIASMLRSTSEKNNSLLGDETSIEYSSSPEFSIPETVTYGGRNPGRTLEDAELEDRNTLRNCYRTAFCDLCGTIWFRGNTGFPCTGCGDGRMTPNHNTTTESAFDGQIDNAMSIFEAKCARLDEEKRGTVLKRKILG